MDQLNLNPEEVPASVVGLGLMGCSITVCLLMAGHPVVAIAPIPGDLITAKGHVSVNILKSLCRKELMLRNTKTYFPGLPLPKITEC